MQISDILTIQEQLQPQFDPEFTFIHLFPSSVTEHSFTAGSTRT